MQRTFLYTKECQVKRKLFLQNVPQFSITGVLTLTFGCTSSLIGPTWTVCSGGNAGDGLFLKVAPIPTGNTSAAKSGLGPYQIQQRLLDSPVGFCLPTTCCLLIELSISRFRHQTLRFPHLRPKHQGFKNVSVLFFLIQTLLMLACIFLQHLIGYLKIVHLSLLVLSRTVFACGSRGLHQHGDGQNNCIYLGSLLVDPNLTSGKTSYQ